MSELCLEFRRPENAWVPRAFVMLAAMTALGLFESAQAQSRRSERAHAGSIMNRPEEIARPEAVSGPSLAATDLMVAQVRIEGNATIPTNEIAARIKTRQGRPYDPSTVQRDVKSLVTLPWFVDVQTFQEDTPAGKVIVFRVVERPTIRIIDYLGNNSIRDKALAKETGLKVGDAIDPYIVEEGRRKIEEVYRRNGFNHVQVSIAEGTKLTDHGVTYIINEGVAQKIWATKFEGNSFASDGQLRHKIKSKHGFAYVFKNYVDIDQIEADEQLLTAYYRAFGFFQAKVSHVLEYNDAGTWATVRFVIHEGPRYRIRNVTVAGNKLFATEDLTAGFKLISGMDFEQAKLAGDSEWLKLLYGSRGHVFADIQAETRFLETPGEIDLIYRIDEGDRFRVGEIFVHIGGENPHTRIQTALNRFSLRPGDVVDIREIRASERRLQASGLFLSDPARNIYPKISFKIPELEDEYLADEGGMTIRGQSPAPPAGTRAYTVRRPATPGDRRAMDVHLYLTDEPPTPTQEQSPQVQQSQSQPSAPVVHTVQKWPLEWGSGQPTQTHTSQQYQSQAATNQQAARATPYSALTIRGQSPAPSDPWQQASQQEYLAQQPAARTAANPAYSNLANGGNNYGGSLPGATGPNAIPAGGVQPVAYGETLPPPSVIVPPGQPVITPYAPMTPADTIIAPPQFADPLVDIHIDTAETQTGRFLMGVGVNSDAGVTGQIMLDEQNFDWRNPPTSWNDIWSGSAFRGDGQRFRLEAAPGTRVQRYLASWSDAYFMDTPISLGLSGSYYTRRYRDWDEQRTGGRVSLGYQWTASDVSARFSYRGESVEVFEPSNPAVPDIQEVLGTNNLHGFRVTVINDTRDNAFLPTSGHYLELYGEGVVGSFSYPRGGVEYRRYFLLNERADHSGRHVLSMSTNVEVTGSNTPVYDRLFAGGFSTMRGFDFRGASPVVGGMQVGGDFLWLNSVEYMFPITADDMIHGVVFCDFGTVEPNVAINDFRVAPGVGLRLTVPAMGPAPIALDFAFPVAKADFDDTRVFSFSVGFLR